MLQKLLGTLNNYLKVQKYNAVGRSVRSAELCKNQMLKECQHEMSLQSCQDLTTFVQCVASSTAITDNCKVLAAQVFEERACKACMISCTIKDRYDHINGKCAQWYASFECLKGINVGGCKDKASLAIHKLKSEEEYISLNCDVSYDEGVNPKPQQPQVHPETKQTQECIASVNKHCKDLVNKAWTKCSDIVQFRVCLYNSPMIQETCKHLSMSQFTGGDPCETCYNPCMMMIKSKLGSKRSVLTCENWYSAFECMKGVDIPECTKQAHVRIEAGKSTLSYRELKCKPDYDSGIKKPKPQGRITKPKPKSQGPIPKRQPKPKEQTSLLASKAEPKKLETQDTKDSAAQLCQFTPSLLITTLLVIIGVNIL